MTYLDTAGSVPFRGRSSGIQNGLGRKRMSKTRSASSGIPYLKPKDITARRSRGPPEPAKIWETLAESWWTLRPDVSIRTSAPARRSVADSVRGLRRPQPLEGTGRMLGGMIHEREMLGDLRAEADVLIDTSG